jgi:hypothetical protein
MLVHHGGLNLVKSRFIRIYKVLAGETGPHLAWLREARAGNRRG